MTAQVAISAKIHQRDDTLKDMDLLYEELGRSVALQCDSDNFDWCRKRMGEYLEQKQKLQTLADHRDMLQSKLEALADQDQRRATCRKEKQLADGKLNELLSRYGACCFEAYVSGSLDSKVAAVVQPVFGKMPVSHDVSDTGKSSKLFSKFHQRHLQNQRKTLFKAFMAAGFLLEKEELLSKVPSQNYEDMSAAYEKLHGQKLDVENRLKELDDMKELLKGEGREHLTSEIDQYVRLVADAEAALKDTARKLGEELYASLPDTITGAQVGNEAITVIDQITLHRRQCEEIDRDIEKLKNEIRIGEISAKITYERQKVEALQKQINSCKTQIEKINSSIDDKRRQIIQLKSKGIYNMADTLEQDNDRLGGPYAN